MNDCNLCHLRNGCKFPVWYRGNIDAEIAIFAEAPGKEEDHYGYPMVGSSGLVLERMLESIGVDPKSVYISNVVKCRPKNNRQPTKPEVKFCSDQYLQKELESLVNLRHIILLGKTAYYAFYKKEPKITLEIGKTDTIQVRDKEVTTVLLYHPSYLLRNPSLEPNTPKHTQWIKLIEWAVKYKISNLPFDIVESDRS